MKCIVGQPGPNGPFYSVVRQSGNIVALQIPDEATAKHIALLVEILDDDYDNRAAGIRLNRIIKRDIPDPVKPVVIDGGFGYVVRSVIEALFGDAPNSDKA